MALPRSMYLALLILEALGVKYVIFVTARRNRISTLTEFCEVNPKLKKKKKKEYLLNNPGLLY